MLYVNSQVARPECRRGHKRPRLAAGERLYVPRAEADAIPLDGTTGVTTREMLDDLRGSVGDWGSHEGCTWNLE